MTSQADGLFIVFEGGDAVGKSTQMAWLAAALEQAGRPHVETFEPGATWVGERIRDLVLNPASGPICARAEALLYLADKAQHVAEVIKPNLADGLVVVSDRYTDSAIAYQGAGRQLTGDGVEMVELATWATGGLRPDLTILLDADPTEAVEAIEAKDRLEGAGLDLHLRVRQEYLDLAASDPDHYLILSADLPRHEIAAAIRDRLNNFGLELSAPPGMMDE